MLDCTYWIYRLTSVIFPLRVFDFIIRGILLYNCILSVTGGNIIAGLIV